MNRDGTCSAREIEAEQRLTRCDFPSSYRSRLAIKRHNHLARRIEADLFEFEIVSFKRLNKIAPLDFPNLQCVPIAKTGSPSRRQELTVRAKRQGPEMPVLG